MNKIQKKLTIQVEIEKGKKGKKTISESYKFIYRVYNSRCRMKS